MRHPRQPRTVLALAAALSCAAALGGCASFAEQLMATPVLYHDGDLDPFAHLPADARTTSLEVFYVTGRRPAPRGSSFPYENAATDGFRIGAVDVRFGAALSWSQLHAASVSAERAAAVPLLLGDAVEHGQLPATARADGEAALDPGQQALVARLNARLRAAADPDLLVYVHGVNVGSYHCTVRSAQLTHFAGRDLVTVVFDWPSHTNIVDYVWGSDGDRARAAAAHLVDVLTFLAEHTVARRIHLLCYSAGAIVGAEGLAALRAAAADADPAALAARYRIGAVVFAAGDLAADEFAHLAPSIHDLAGRITVTCSDADSALQAAEWFMGGGRRLGVEGAPDAAELALRARLPRLEVLDVSLGHETRGFDIGGHHYWYEHPWVASDVILNLRLDVPAADRGLAPGPTERTWFLPADYPQRARAVVRERLRGAWRLPADEP